MFIIFQVIVFCGLIICCTYSSEITVLIIVNILNSVLMFKNNITWIIISDLQINSDTIIKLTLVHYISAIYFLYIGIIHTLDIHYDWKNEKYFDGFNIKQIWFDESLSYRVNEAFLSYLIIYIFVSLLYHEPDTLSYELFTLNDIGAISDIRFSCITPHWYFRSYMSWILSCQTYEVSVIGLILFFVLLYYQVLIQNTNSLMFYSKKSLIYLNKINNTNTINNQINLNKKTNFYSVLMYYIFSMCCLYTGTFLPGSRFFWLVGGNTMSLLSFLFIFSYLSFYSFKTSFLLEFYFNNFFHYFLLI